MKPLIDLDRFRTEYRRVIGEISRFITPEHQRVISRHNPGLEPSRTDLSSYLRASEIRYTRALRLFNDHLATPTSQLHAFDVGGFLGAYPLTLTRIGIRSTLAEAYSYYSGALDDLSTFLASEGVEVWDVDFTQSFDASNERTFSMVSNMAMLEHLAGSPAQLMENLRGATADDGALVVEVPNIAYWPKRTGLLRGHSVHPPLEDVLRSASPFMGHHREYTAGELTELLESMGFTPLTVDLFNYSIELNGSLFDRMRLFLFQLGPTLVLRSAREVIMAIAVPRVVSG